MAGIQKEADYNQSFIGANWKEIVAKRMADVIDANGAGTLTFGNFRVEMDGKWATIFEGSTRIGAFYKGQVLGSEHDAVMVVKMLQVAFKAKVDGMWGKNTEKAYKKQGKSEEAPVKIPEGFVSLSSTSYSREAEFNRSYLGTDWKEKVASSAANLISLFSPGTYSYGNYSVVMVGDKAILYENGSLVQEFTPSQTLSDDGAVNLVKAVQTVVKAKVDGKWGKNTDKAYRLSRGRTGSVREEAPPEIQQQTSEKVQQTSVQTPARTKFEEDVDKIVRQAGKQGSESFRKFIRTSFLAYYNASSQHAISSGKFMAVDVSTNTMYFFDMNSMIIEDFTFVALGSGGISSLAESYGTPEGMSACGPVNTGGRGGFQMPGKEKHNKNNDSRLIRIHNRDGPDGDLHGNQKTTSGCLGIGHKWLDMLGEKVYRNAGVFVYVKNVKSQYLSESFLQ